MAQHDYIISNATFPAVRTDINNALSAIQTNNSGTSRPTGAVAGQIWLDTTNATSPTLKFYDGADDISLATINYTANTVDWLDSSITITGLSTTATGTVLTLSDTANTTTQNLIIDNQKEIRFRETTANGTNYIALKAPASVASDLTFTLPATDGASGQALVTNGSGVLSFASAGTSWQSVQTTGFTAVAGRGYPCNTTSAGFTVTLPASPSAGDEIILLDYAGTFDTNALTINPNGNKIEGATDNLRLIGDREGVRLVYIDSTQGWIGVSGFQEGTDALSPNTTSVEALIIAGGGGGGGTNDTNGSGAGGGGAGGYRTSTQTINLGTSYTVTVGAGGNGGAIDNNGASGSNSVFNTITSAGGGGGAKSGFVTGGISGGSGGGGSDAGKLGGSGNTPSTSPSQGNNGGAGNGLAPNYAGGGGGGASAVGADGTSTAGGNGGAGTASSITGSSVTRAGGGGGGTFAGGTAGTGGTGGGGNANINAGGSAGTANTGGGGGAGSYKVSPNTAYTGGNGGSGIVILKYANTFTISNSGGGLTFSTSTSGSDKITSFTAGTGSIQLN